MLENKKLEEAKRNAIKSINSGIIYKTKESKYVDFFIKNAKDSLDSAKVLFELSTNDKTNIIKRLLSHKNLILTWI